MKMMHVTVYASDIDASIDFYEKVAGLKVVREKRAGENRVVFLNDGTQDFCLELARGNDQNHYEGKNISIGFGCEDLDKQRNHLESLGITAGPLISPRPDVRFFFISDPDGLQIQFMEVPGQSEADKETEGK